MKKIAVRNEKTLWLDDGQDLKDIDTTGIIEDERGNKIKVSVHSYLKMGIGRAW